jgi:hypothetical protein
MQAIFVNQQKSGIQTHLELKKIKGTTLRFGDLELQEKGSKLFIRTHTTHVWLKITLFRFLPWLLIATGLLGMTAYLPAFTQLFSNWIYLVSSVLGGVLLFIPIHTHDFIDDGIFYRNTNYFHFSIHAPVFISKNAQLVVDIQSNTKDKVSFCCISNHEKHVLFTFTPPKDYKLEEVSQVSASLLSKLDECTEIEFHASIS